MIRHATLRFSPLRYIAAADASIGAYYAILRYRCRYIDTPYAIHYRYDDALRGGVTLMMPLLILIARRAPQL